MLLLITHGVVAPYVGAWIETCACYQRSSREHVAPYVGAWIETLYPFPRASPPLVAPYVGAWIETASKAVRPFWRIWSHPTWVRGLKHRNRLQRESRRESHPTWVRGLKHLLNPKRCKISYVAPYVGAWIETIRRWTHDWLRQSHPTWVRGLKRLRLYCSLAA